MLADRVRMGSGKKSNLWANIQKIVRQGLANEHFSVGDQLISSYDDKEIIWEVIGINIDTPTNTQFQYSMTIQTKDCLEKRAVNSGNDNRYLTSPIRQYLNGDFLNRIDPELSLVLGEVNKKVAKMGGGQDSFSDKVFLLSRFEVQLGGTSTGFVYPFYNGADNAKRIKNLDNTPDNWWLRSPYMEASNSLYYVRSKGDSLYGKSSASFGLAPACVII